MTRERDRIQKNANKYIVKNCPTLMGNRLCYSKEIRQCADCTDCVIKQVIDKCKGNKEHALEYLGHRDMLAEEILQLFDIEEINK